MPVILIGSNKGGSGKTTTSINLAAGIAYEGYDVCLIDADQQRSVSQWIDDRQESIISDLIDITVVQKNGNLQPTIKSLREKYDFLIIDVAGRNSRELLTALICTDLLLTPATNSQLDLDTLTELEIQVTNAKDLNPNIKSFIYTVMCTTHAKGKVTAYNEMKEFIKDFEDFHLLKSVSHYRKVYQTVIPDGLSVLEQKKDMLANKEVKLLVTEVLAFVNK